MLSSTLLEGDTSRAAPDPTNPVGEAPVPPMEGERMKACSSPSTRSLLGFEQAFTCPLSMDSDGSVPFLPNTDFPSATPSAPQYPLGEVLLIEGERVSVKSLTKACIPGEHGDAIRGDPDELRLYISSAVLTSKFKFVRLKGTTSERPRAKVRHDT